MERSCGTPFLRTTRAGRCCWPCCRRFWPREESPAVSPTILFTGLNDQYFRHQLSPSMRASFVWIDKFTLPQANVMVRSQGSVQTCNGVFRYSLQSGANLFLASMLASRYLWGRCTCVLCPMEPSQAPSGARLALPADPSWAPWVPSDSLAKAHNFRTTLSLSQVEG